MRLSSSAAVLGAATALAYQDQKVLGTPSEEHHHQHVIEFEHPAADVSDFSSWYKPLEKLFGEFTSEAKATWDEISLFVPDAVEQFKKQALSGKASPHNRRPDSEWDHIVKGADVQSAWVEGADGESHRKVGGKLENYNLRVRKHDPSKLGVDTVKQMSGYLDDEEKDKHLFYWFFESRNDPKNDPVMLWLNGGPGCSSLMGLLLELGPAGITKKGEVKLNEYSWNSNASVIFLDQPVGTGYSYGSGQVSNTLAAAKDVYALLTLFFEEFPEYSKQSFTIAGESYGGHYVPAIASEILSHKDRNINLKSIAVGNGLTDGYTQYPEYKPMACGEGGYAAVIDESGCKSMESSISRCQSLISSCYNSGSAWTCVPAQIYCNNAFLVPYQRTGLNVYDIREECKGGSLCYEEIPIIEDWLNQEDVKEALGAEVQGYDSCNFDINRNFMLNGDWMKPMHQLIPNLLEQIPVLIYAGDADFICNWLGNQAWTNALEWDGAEGFSKAKNEDLKLGSGKDAKKYGKVKSYGNFTFMQIFEAGHMTPMDQPEASLDFINRFINGEWTA